VSQKVVLCILDGWGISSDSSNSGLVVAKNWQNFLEKYPNCILQASETFVGLPKGQMGNSEVGHTTIGLGRVIKQDLPKIDEVIEDGSLWNQDQVRELVSTLKNNQKACHLMGLLSDGGVHSHQDHIFAITKYLLSQSIPVKFHSFLDGRDTPPNSAINFAKKTLELFSDNPLWQWSTVSGRFFAMDRDKRWDRTEKAYKTIALSDSENKFSKPIDLIQKMYAEKKFDEFIPPSTNKNYHGIENDDGLWMVNFRADRVRQILSYLLIAKQFHKLDEFKFSCTIGMGNYSDTLNKIIPCVIQKQKIDHSLGQIIADSGLRQLRIAETEKYAHVTFFFNGGIETPYPKEERILIPSPSVSTYDQCPEMSAIPLTDTLIKNIKSKKFDFVVVNYANPDMVGHTGVKEAIFKAVETVDNCLLRLKNACIENDYTLIITADHGNVESILDKNHLPHTAHTCNPVPFVIIDKKIKSLLKNIGSLQDIAPTILKLMEIKIPIEMQGVALV
jgi:2,3-bisphosphoglycerate-independent phosphoglycerate mutase